MQPVTSEPLNDTKKVLWLHVMHVPFFLFLFYEDKTKCMETVKENVESVIDEDEEEEEEEEELVDPVRLQLPTKLLRPSAQTGSLTPVNCSHTV